MNKYLLKLLFLLLFYSETENVSGLGAAGGGVAPVADTTTPTLDEISGSESASSDDPLTITTETAVTVIVPDIFSLYVGMVGPDCFNAINALGFYDIDPIICRCYGIGDCAPKAVLDQIHTAVLAIFGQATIDQNRAEHFGVCAALVLIFILGITGNILVLLTSVKHMPKNNVTNMFLQNLAVVDIMVLVICIPVRILVYIGYFVLFPPEAYWACYVTQYIYYFSFTLSILTMTAIGTERYLAICYPMKAQHIATPERAVKIIVAVWIISALLSIPTYLGSRISAQTCLLDFLDSVYFPILSYYIFFVILLVPALTLLVVYTRICITLWKSIAMQQKLQQSQRSSTGPKDENEEKSNEKQITGRKKIIRMLIAVLVAFVCCWSPLLIFHVYVAAMINSSLTRNTISDIAAILNLFTFANTVLNPVLYAFLSSKFREGLFKLLGIGGKKRRANTAYGVDGEQSKSHATSGTLAG